MPRHAGPVADTAWRAAWKRIPPTRQEDISRVYANIGKAIAAYERRIDFAPSRFDRYVQAELAGRPHAPESVTTDDEVYKTPSLRGVAERAPYMPAGQFASLGEVLRHYNGARAAPFGHSELTALRLSPVEQPQLEAFLRTLSSPLAAPPGFLEPPSMNR